MPAAEVLAMLQEERYLLHRFAVRENDGAEYVISLGGRINQSLLDLIPAFCNVRLRFVDNSTMHSDTCSFQRAFLDYGNGISAEYTPAYLLLPKPRNLTLLKPVDAFSRYYSWK